jgi:hypothetical protein
VHARQARSGRVTAGGAVVPHTPARRAPGRHGTHRGASARPQLTVVAAPSRSPSGTAPSPYSANRYSMMASLSYMALPVLGSTR